MNYQDRLKQWPRLGVTSVRPTEALVKQFTQALVKQFKTVPPRVLMFNGEPVGLVDLAMQAPLMGGLDVLQHAGALSMLLAEVLDLMQVPPGETLEQKVDRRLKLQLLLDDAGEAVNAFASFCAEIEVANSAAKNEALGKVVPS